jgi:hypothetical protein
MFACSCCIVIGAFVLSREGQICKSTPDGGARSQFRELSSLSPVKQRQAHWIPLIHILHMLFQPQPSACYSMHDMILRQVIMATQPLPQSIFILLDIFVSNDLRKGVSFQKKMFFKMGMMKGCHPYHP